LSVWFSRLPWRPGGGPRGDLNIAQPRPPRPEAAFTLVYYAITDWAALRLRPGQRKLPRLLSWLGLGDCLALVVSLPITALIAAAAALGIAVAGRLPRRRLDRPHAPVLRSTGLASVNESVVAYLAREGSNPHGLWARPCLSSTGRVCGRPAASAPGIIRGFTTATDDPNASEFGLHPKAHPAGGRVPCMAVISYVGRCCVCGRAQGYRVAVSQPRCDAHAGPWSSGVAVTFAITDRFTDRLAGLPLATAASRRAVDWNS
jgi:hypothetical protein